MVSRSEVEIMAPVGSFESLAAAIQGGADSVYFGIGSLNMRAQSSVNFTINDLKEIVRRSKEANIKTYLTANTAVFDSETEELKQIIKTAKDEGVTAVIASDMAVISYCSEIGIEVHSSTQLSISNFEAVKFWAKFADVVVLAREVNLNQVREIHKRIVEEKITGPSGNLVKIEMFVHGALCMAISGKCYLSLHEYNYSANKGRCLQVCRRAYEVTDLETGRQLKVDNEYIMSPKDLKTIHFLNKLLESGVSVLKIEGRARPAEYVKVVTECYKEAVNSIYDGSFNENKIKEWDKRLATVFNRGFWDGYYLGKKLGEWSSVYGSLATQKKEYVGKVTNFFSNLNVAEIHLQAGELGKGDNILIIGETTGVVEEQITEIRVDLEETTKAEKGEKLSIKTNSLVRRGDKVYKIVKLEEPDLTI